MIITRENIKEEASNLPEMFFAEAIKRTVTNERAFYDEEVPPENAGETFKKLLVKEVVKNEH